MKRRVLIMGAAGRDFHNFNTVYRDNPQYEVVAFTATQIPEIEGRSYPASLAGEMYPKGIPIHEEKELLSLIQSHNIDDVVFSYSDVSHEYVMHQSARVNGVGANFLLLGTKETMIKSNKPMISVCAARTGCGKSQTSRAVVETLLNAGKKVVTIRHPMPYGNLEEQAVQRFSTYEDLDKHKCTIEEREEYEPYVDMGAVIYSGIDYAAILEEAEKEADVIVWDGGNNDTSFYKPDLNIVVVDPHRPGHELKYYPGETNVRMADVIVINKVDTADNSSINLVEENIRMLNPNASIIYGASPIFIDDPSLIRGKKVLVIEDGPTLTHGEMPYGAGTVAARRYGAGEILDPRPFSKGSIKEAYLKYPHLGNLVPALGYYPAQLKELEATVNESGADVIISGTPIDITRVISVKPPIMRLRYRLQEIGDVTLKSSLTDSGII